MSTFVDWLNDTRPITYTPPPACRPGSIHRLAHIASQAMTKAEAWDRLVAVMREGCEGSDLKVEMAILICKLEAGDGAAAPPRARLAEMTRLNIKTVDAAKARLREAGHLDWDNRYDDGAYARGQPARHYRWQDTNAYTIPPPGLRHMRSDPLIGSPSPPSAKLKKESKLLRNKSVDKSGQVPEDPRVFVDPQPRDWRAIAELQNRQIAGQQRKAARRERDSMVGYVADAEAGTARRAESAEADAERMERARAAAELEEPPWRPPGWGDVDLPY